MTTKKVNKIFVLLISLTLLLSCSKKEKTYIVGGSGFNKIVKITQSGKILWSHKIEKGQECNEVNELPNGNILYAYKKGAKIITPDHKTVWKYDTPEKTELQSASITNEGNILLGQCGNPTKIIEFSMSGKKLKEVAFDSEVKNPHAQLRRVRKSNTGTYLVPIFARRSICEVNDAGNIVSEIEVPGNPFAVVPLKNNNWLVACGDAHKLVEINPSTKEIVWQLNENDIEGISLRFVAGLTRLENGNTIICSWGGHSRGKDKMPQFFEIDKNSKLVWKVQDYNNLGNISTAYPCSDKNFIR